MAKLPDNQYYIQLGFKEVLYDGTLRSIDDTAQNIWMMMFLQSLSYDEIGHFKVNGKPLLINEIAKVLGRDIKKLNRVLPILLKVGLCEQLEDGTIIIPSSKFDQLAGNLHAKCQKNDGKMTAKRRQNAEQNGQKQQKNEPPIKEKNINIKDKKEKSNKKESENLVGDKEDVSPIGSTKKGHRLPDDWMPNENDIAYAQKLNLDPEKIAEDFCDYWHAKAGAGARKTDWSLTWKTWCRRENEKYQEKQQRFNAYNQPRKSNLERIGEKIDRAAEHYGVDDWFENGVPQDLSTKPKLQLVGGSKW